LSALLLVLSAVWAKARRTLALPNAVLAVFVVILVPITTNAGEWLEQRVDSTALLRTHTELGDTALFFAIPVAILALVVWWRQRESVIAAQPPVESDVDASAAGTTTTIEATRRRTFLAPASTTVTTVIAVLVVLAAGAACYQVYRIGDSGAQASWQGQFSSQPAPRGDN
jgi:hypothetical protein